MGKIVIEYLSNSDDCVTMVAEEINSSQLLPDNCPHCERRLTITYSEIWKRYKDIGILMLAGYKIHTRECEGCRCSIL